MRATVQRLGGDRLHLSDGPIDVVLKAWGTDAAVAAAERAAVERFVRVLDELCGEIGGLRTPVGMEGECVGGRPSPTMTEWGGVERGSGTGKCVGGRPSPTMTEERLVRERDRLAGLAPGHLPPALKSSWSAKADHPRIALESSSASSEAIPPPSHPQTSVGRRMLRACRPFADRFITPMAAVAGAVSDELLAVMRAAAPITRAFVNDGGDIAVWCGPGEAMAVGIAGGFDLSADALPEGSGTIRVTHGDRVGGIATSGARGRSFSLGIADSVTVLAADAATADAAATMIANAVDADHPAVVRKAARALDPDSDLGDRKVTVSVGALDEATIRSALRRGADTAETYRQRGLILGAMLTLQGRSLVVGAKELQTRMAS